MRTPPLPATGHLCGFVALGSAPSRRGVITPSQQASVYFLWKHSEVGVSGMQTSVRARTSKANMLQIWPPAYLRAGWCFSLPLNQAANQSRATACSCKLRSFISQNDQAVWSSKVPQRTYTNLVAPPQTDLMWPLANCMLLASMFLISHLNS